MPPTRTKKSPEEQRIERAISDIKDGTIKSCAAAARQHRITYDKLYGRLHGRVAPDNLGGHNKALSEEQETALGLYVNRCEELGRPCKHKHIELAANSLLRASGSKKTVSRAWTSRFIKRTGIFRQRTKSLSAQRKAAQSRSDIELYFEKFKHRARELKIKPHNLYNFDETGFRIGCLAGLVVFTSTDRQVYISDPDNREQVTSMECINAAGGTIHPMLIMPGQIMKEKHFPKGLHDGIRIAVSESGYTNDVLSLEWLKHFDDQTRPTDGEWRMLIMDGHGSHLTIEFVDYCYQPEVNISVFLLPPHSTHLLQPLDIGVFQSFKHYHQELLEESIRFAGVDYKRTDFLASFQAMRDLTFKTKTICSAFRKAGLHPFNPSAVLSKLREFSTPERTLALDDEAGSDLEFEVDYSKCVTPLSPRIYKAYSSYIQKKMDWNTNHGIPLTLTSSKLILKQDKATRIKLLNGQLAIEDQFKRRQAEMDKQRTNGDRTVQHFGTIKVGDARLRMMNRNEEEDRQMKAIRERKEESARLKREREEGIQRRHEERMAKRAEKEAELQARADVKRAKAVAKANRIQQAAPCTSALSSQHLPFLPMPTTPRPMQFLPVPTTPPPIPYNPVPIHPDLFYGETTVAPWFS